MAQLVIMPWKLNTHGFGWCMGATWYSVLGACVLAGKDGLCPLPGIDKAIRPSRQSHTCDQV